MDFSFNYVYFCCLPEQGFITILESPGPVQADIKEGESLGLRVKFDAYPAPSSLSWSYNGKQILNTTEHVITVHRRKYRYSKLTVYQMYINCKYTCMCKHRICLIRYTSELRLVRVLGSEGGIYKFSASHEDASVDHSFHVYVISK